MKLDKVSQVHLGEQNNNNINFAVACFWFLFFISVPRYILELIVQIVDRIEKKLVPSS